MNWQGFRQQSGAMRRIHALVMGFLFLAAGGVRAAEIESLASIREAVSSFLEREAGALGGDIEVSVAHLDSRLRLARCQVPLSASWPPSARKRGTVTVQVSCEAPRSWSLYVQARVQVFENIMVTSRPMSRGQLLSTQDVEAVRQDISSLYSGYYTRNEEVAGMVLKRSVRAGMVVTPALVAPQRLIRRGEKVSIIAATGTVQVRMDGKAMMDGAKGEVIRVRNLSSKHEVEAVVVSQGVVQVRM
jgi:flagella basal body P-ring formation protein FlgA